SAQVTAADHALPPAKIQDMEQSRRSFLASVAVGSQEWVRYQDPATEFDVRRLTSPEHESTLSPPPARCIDRRSKILLFSAKSEEKWAPFQIDLSNGQIKPIAVVEEYAPESLTFSADDRSALFFSGSKLISIQLGNQHRLELAEIRDNWQHAGPAGFDRGWSITLFRRNQRRKLEHPAVAPAQGEPGDRRRGAWRGARHDPQPEARHAVMAQ
ncbi:MAG: hypothetical protein QM757_10280, partial [Paludibaculum sp.]